MSKFLYYYPFLHETRVYVLKTIAKLDINFTSKPGINLAPAKLLLLDESHSIVERFKCSDLLESCLNSETSSRLDTGSEYVSCLSGILLEKRLMTNNHSNKHKAKSNDADLASHFDILVPNREYKLMVKLDDHEDDMTVIKGIFLA